jgi:predicted aldo/keto reductase-like oxidoreductase
MKHRPCGKTGIDLPVVSFGGMRVGRIKDNPDLMNRLVARAVELGVTFFETCYHYGTSEEQIGRALDETGLRGKAILSTKSNDTAANDADGVRRVIDEQLRRLRTDHLEFYQMWNIGSQERFDAVMRPGANYDTVAKLRDQGVIDHIGLTVHAPNEDVIRWLETGAFESVTVYYNAIERTPEPVVRRAAELGLGVMVMGPLNGGLLGDPAASFEFLHRGGATTNAQGALRWLLGHPEVTCVLSGMSRLSELEENAAVADLDLEVGADDYAEADRRLAAFEDLKKSVCTECGYCKGCPSQIEIWGVMRALNIFRVYGALREARERFQRYLTKHPGPDACTECGECVEKCPQHLDIPERLKEAQARLGGKS